MEGAVFGAVPTAPFKRHQRARSKIPARVRLPHRSFFSQSRWCRDKNGQNPYLQGRRQGPSGKSSSHLELGMHHLIPPPKQPRVLVGCVRDLAEGAYRCLLTRVSRSWRLRSLYLRPVEMFRCWLLSVVFSGREVDRERLRRLHVQTSLRGSTSSSPTIQSSLFLWVGRGRERTSPYPSTHQ